MAIRRTSLIATALALALGAATSASAQVRSSSSALAIAGEAVVQVVPLDGGGQAGEPGVGFFTATGRLVTAGGVVRGAHQAIVRFGGREARVTAVLAEDRQAGLVVLSVDLPEGAPPSLSPAPFRSSVAAGDSLFALSPGGARHPVRLAPPQSMGGLGLVSLVHPTDGGLRDGTPVVSETGDLAGVVIAPRTGAAGQLLVVPVARLAAMPPLQPSPLGSWSALSAEIEVQQRHHDRGVALADAGQWKAALREFSEVARLRPSDADAHFNRGTVLGQLRRYEEERQAYEATLRLAPSHLGALRNLGVACLALKRIPEALAAFRRAIALAPTDAELHTSLGVACFDARDYVQAIAAFSDAIQRDPQLAKAHYGLGLAQAAAGNREAAQAICTRLRALDGQKADRLQAVLASSGR